MAESAASRRLRQTADPLGRFLTDAFHFVGLFAIGGATAWAAFFAFVDMMQKGHASIDDLLLLFIYLEIGSMVGIYFRTNHMPVRFLVYVGITAITRHLIVYVQNEAEPTLGIIYLAGATLILAAAVFVIRYTSFHYPSRSESDGGHEVKTD
ncbi:MAG: phosphate-starvation-inducible PsiE family protein [Hyphomicrobiales bacterium]